MPRPIRAVIHTAALQHNLALAKSLAPQSRILAVIKADGYGHGMLRVAEALRDAEGFAVLRAEEGIALRQAGFQQTILLLEGAFDAEDIAAAAQHRLTLVVHNEDQIGLLQQADLPQQIAVFIKINTGMNRLGFLPTRFWAAYDRLKACRNVLGLTLMTHFATADEAVGIEEQLERFTSLTEEISLPKSVANSAALIRYPQARLDWVRPGIMIYGSSPFADQSAQEIGLRPVMRLTSRIISVQDMSAGSTLGYGRLFMAERPVRVGIVACGYADGYPRHAPTGTPIAVAGKRTRTLGRVSMDMLYVDLTDIPEADVGSTVELWGEQVSVDEVAQSSGTVGYELLCALAPRVPVEQD